MERNARIAEAARRNLKWFERSGVMDPADGGWGVAERLSVAEGPALEKMLNEFPAWSRKPEGYVLEQRRADCNFEAALLFRIAAEYGIAEEAGRIGEKLLDYLYFRSGLLNRCDPAFPAGSWNWSHIKWRDVVYFDDNAWCIFIPLALADRSPELDAKYDLRNWALILADSLVPAMRRTFGAENPQEPGTWRDPEQRWHGRLELPHWGSLEAMALSRAFLCRPAPDYREQVRRYHDYLAETLEAFTVSEHAYALLGAATAFRAFGEAADRALAERAANLILSKLDPETGNIPAEHYEAPKGTHLVDTVYTVNWSFLALQMAAKLTGDARIAAAKEKQLELLLSIQDRSESAFFHGCWRGMFDLHAGKWGGGDCYEGGAGSIYTGWTNAPIALGLLLESRNGSLLDL